MVRFRREAIAALRYFDRPTLDAMLQQHYEELTFNKERVKLKPRWDTYEFLDEADKFIALTARDGDRLVGYNAFFVDTHMHYANLTVAVNDVFYLHPDHRRGATALRFLRFTEDYFKDRADKLAYHFKASNNLGPILKRLGYAHEEGVAAKLL